MSEYHWFQSTNQSEHSKFVFKSLMPCNRSESMPMFSKQEYSEGFSAWLSGMFISWRITLILYIEENINFLAKCRTPMFFRNTEKKFFLFSSERKKVTSWSTLQRNTMLLTAGRSVGRCWSGFSTVVLINFHQIISFLTFCHKHKRGLLDTTNYSRHP